MVLYMNFKDTYKSMKKSKILICGGAGYIGGALTDLLQQNNYEVVVYDNLLYETRFLKNVPFIYGDVRDYKKLSSIINDFDIVVWLAAIVGDEACAFNPSVTREVNVNSVKWLADNFKGKIIFTSSCSVYGINNNLIDESADTNPLSLYAETKIEAEKIILNSSNSKNHLIFRLGTLFGISDTHSRLRFDLVVNTLTMRAAVGETLMVFGGGQWRPIVHVKDVAEAIMYSIQKDISGLYNLSYKNYMMKDIAEEIQKTLVDLGTRVEYTNVKFEDLRNYRVSSEKFKAYGWQPKYGLDQGIGEVYRQIREGRIKEPQDPVYSNATFIKSRFI